MRIGFFTDTYFPQISGVATSIKTLKEELENKGHEVIIFTTTDPNASDMEENIVRMPSIPFISFKDRRIVVSGMLDAYEKAKDYHLDIIHTHTEFGAGWLGKHIAKQLSIPVVHTYHTMYEDYLHYIAHGKLIRPYHVKQASRAFCRQLSGIVCPSDRVVQKLRQYQIYSPMAVIPTGVNLDKFSTGAVDNSTDLRTELGLAEDTVLLLSLSRLSYEKNIQAIIQGMPQIIEKVPNARLLIVGNGPYFDDLQEIVELLELAETVLFLGEINNDDVGRYYYQADYFVNASTSESQGLTYIESLAAGTKLVAKSNDYIEQLVDSSTLGVTFENDEDFAECFIEYFQNSPIEDKEVRDSKLFEISSKNFALEIERFYREAQSYHNAFINDEPEEKSHLTLKLFRRKN